VLFYFIMAIFFQNKIMCKFCKWRFRNFFHQKLPYFEEKQSDFARDIKKQQICWKKIPKFREVRKYCHDAWRPWREAKSCSTGDRPPTHYFNTGHRPGFWFLDAHLFTHKPPALALALALIPFVTTPMLMDTR
jgi:hypothetical protein